MSTTRIDQATGKVAVEPTRARQTERPSTPFRNVLASSLNVLMSGAEVATSVMGAPLLAAAVRETRTEVVKSVGPRRSDPLEGTEAVAAETPGSEVGRMHAMQRESQAFNLQFLALQEEVQQENRRFSTLSNVLRARHDTAKAAVANIRG